MHQTKPGDALERQDTRRLPPKRKASITLAAHAEQENLEYYANSPLREIFVLLRYRVAVKWRMGWFIASKLAIPILVGAVYSSFFNSLPKNFWGSFTTAGLLFVTVALAGFLSIAPARGLQGRVAPRPEAEAGCVLQVWILRHGKDPAGDSLRPDGRARLRGHHLLYHRPEDDAVRLLLLHADELHREHG